MADESHSFSAAKSRLDEIVTQVRKKDTSLEKSLDLLEEGVRLANICTEQIDQTDWTSADMSKGSDAVAVVDGDTGRDNAHEGAAAEEATSEQDTSAVEGAPSDGDAAVADVEEDDSVGEVWSDDEAWADEAQDDPSDGDDGHGA